jgi:hypothetical protein
VASSTGNGGTARARTRRDHRMHHAQ